MFTKIIFESAQIAKITECYTQNTGLVLLILYAKVKLKTLEKEKDYE